MPFWGFRIAFVRLEFDERDCANDKKKGAQALNMVDADENLLFLEHIDAVDVSCALIDHSGCSRMVQDSKLKNQFRVNHGFF